MFFGTAKDIITPIKPMKLACSGGDFDNPFLTIHDDVYVRTLALKEDETTLIFMTFDLLFHDRRLNDALETYAQSTYGIQPRQMLITYTHAHTAPASRGYNPGAHDDAYEAFLLDRAKACLDRALCAMMPGTLEWGCFDADYNISRRGIIDGAFANAPNFDYEHDTQFFVLCVRDERDRVRSVLMNYACHPVFYPGKRILSGEFPARLCQYIDTAFYGCMSLFCQSAGGDVRPRPTAKRKDPFKPASDAPSSDYTFRSTDFETIDAFASDISKEVKTFICNQAVCNRTDQLSLAAHAFTIDLAMDPAPPEYFKERLNHYKERGADPNKRNAQAIVDGGYAHLSHTLTLHCQILQLTKDFYIASMGGEPCYGVKKAVLAAFTDCDVMFVGYTDACAYLVDDVLLEEGGYEPQCHLEYGLIGPLKPGVTRQYTEQFSAALDFLKKNHNFFQKCIDI